MPFSANSQIRFLYSAHASGTEVNQWIHRNAVRKPTSLGKLLWAATGVFVTALLVWALAPVALIILSAVTGTRDDLDMALCLERLLVYFRAGVYLPGDQACWERAAAGGRGRYA